MKCYKNAKMSLFNDTSYEQNDTESIKLKHLTKIKLYQYTFRRMCKNSKCENIINVLPNAP
jgi:hypothetical protein